MDVGAENLNGVPIEDALSDTIETGAHVEVVHSETNLVHNINIPYILNGELYEIQTLEGENVTVKCCNCPQDRVYRGSVRSTGNFHMHIKRRHPDLIGRLHDMKVFALLERRDRLMRNRKFSQQRSIKSIKRESQAPAVKPPSCSPRPVTPPRLLHTHKLKIHTAFKRHQQQKQQESSVQSHRMEYVEPIDLSCRDIPTSLNDKTQSDQQEVQEHIIDDDLEQRSEHKMKNVVSSQLCSAETVLDQNIEELEEQNDCAGFAANASFITTVSSRSESCSSSGCSETIQRTTKFVPFNNVKQEGAMSTDEAIDLSIQSTNIQSASSSSSNSSGIGSSALLNKTSAGVVNPIGSIIHWDELLVQVEASIRDLQSELHTRNQIETNRILFDIAKFKFLHPGFTFPPTV